MTFAKSITALTTFALISTAQGFELTSQDIEPGKMMPKAQEYIGFGCEGGNLSPQLAWRAIPAGTKSFALTVFDPDAPTGSGWWHWIAYDIPANVRELPRNAGDTDTDIAPEGMLQHRNDYGATGFGGACPPVGDKAHRYQFKIFALDVESLEIDPQSSAALVGYMIHAHKIDEASLEAKYKR
ncbi:MAG: YbhB/YbcL family Raf kinase inhibitor-like protein [Candidatus Thiodiazotropha sp.]